ncbi:Hypothetical predicted protein [Marmota monax]|uniref:Uncharacterized protein n=1 Tax=Marmota monax TaxID=9995 RepID=A0A5E4D6V2_MARMO|nr:Hypothetical predicted protein [Marmota monax]
MPGRSVAGAAPARYSRRCRRRHHGRSHAHPQCSKAAARGDNSAQRGPAHSGRPEPSLHSLGGERKEAVSWLFLLPPSHGPPKLGAPLADDDSPSSPPVLPEALLAAAGSGRCSRRCLCRHRAGSPEGWDAELNSMLIGLQLFRALTTF